MQNFLIKRSNAFRELHKGNSKNKRYFEISIRKTKYYPPSTKIELGDVIYVAETNGGIYAKGIVIKSNDLVEFDCIEDVLQYSKKFKDEAYWMDKIRYFSERLQLDSNYRLRCHEYFVKQELLHKTIPYNGPLTKYDSSVNKGLASIFFNLTEKDVAYLEDKPDYRVKQIGVLKSEIPGDLRLKIYSYFNRSSSIGHLIDIDHFVPKSVGGPGNIIENLVPIGFSLNRYKSDSVPSSFFKVSKYNQYLADLPVSEKDIDLVLRIKDDFIRVKKYPEAKRLAMIINDEIKNWDITRARDFYKKVTHDYNPHYVQQLELLNSEVN